MFRQSRRAETSDPPRADNVLKPVSFLLCKAVSCVADCDEAGEKFHVTV